MSPRLARNPATGSSCRCCAARERALSLALFDTLPEMYSPLTPGIQAANLIHEPERGALKVALGTDWERLLSQLPSVADGIVMSRNEGAILSRRAPYPRLQFSRDRCKAAKPEAGLWLNCRRLGAVHAIHSRRDRAQFFGVEFSDPNGRIIHEFALTPESDLDEFFGWVRLHQACSSDGRPAAGPVERAPERSVLRETSHGDALLAVLESALRRELAIRATVSSGGVRQRIHFTPRSLQAVEGWFFASSDEAGLHFCTKRFTAVGVNPPLGSAFHAAPCLVAEIGENRAALTLETADPCRVLEWNAVVHDLV